MQALDRAKRVQSALTKLVERRERLVQRASAEFRLDLLAVIDPVDDETLALVQRGLAMDRCEAGLQYAVQMAIDERNESRRISTRRSGAVKPPPLPGDPHEAETDAPPPLPSTDSLEGDEDDLTELDLDTPLPPAPATPRLNLEQQVDEDGYRYPEPGEAAVTLPDGRVVAAP